MHARMTAVVGGRDVSFAMPIGALEEVAEVNPRLGELRGVLVAGVWELRELKAVLAAGLKWGGSDATVSEVIEAEGLAGAARIAADLMGAAFRDTSGNSEPPAAGATTADS